MHASTYRNGSAYAGKRVLVVGMGNTGAEIATDLHEHGASRVWISVRTSPWILARDQGPVVTANLLGIVVRHLPVRLVDAIGSFLWRIEGPDLRAYGLPRPAGGLYSGVMQGTIPCRMSGSCGTSGGVRMVARWCSRAAADWSRTWSSSPAGTPPPWRS
ncbi:NAD(P)/FAD-dependent oxidoreductase [Enemella dayhoffiae]|uniref:hypothetical protein n=1 Tax=Enemella dayhoffiae TaxID=2016507 RepID=UPI003898E81B